MIIDIPTIYEENVIEFAQRKGNVIFKYYNDNKICEIEFSCVYFFDFVEFDHILDLDWRFGLELHNDSKYIKEMINGMTMGNLKRAFGGEYTSLRHYKLAIDDVGLYNVVCKDVFFNYS